MARGYLVLVTKTTPHARMYRFGKLTPGVVNRPTYIGQLGNSKDVSVVRQSPGGNVTASHELLHLYRSTDGTGSLKSFGGRLPDCEMKAFPGDHVEAGEFSTNREMLFLDEVKKTFATGGLTTGDSPAPTSCGPPPSGSAAPPLGSPSRRVGTPENRPRARRNGASTRDSPATRARRRTRRAGRCPPRDHRVGRVRCGGVPGPTGRHRCRHGRRPRGRAARRHAAPDVRPDPRAVPSPGDPCTAGGCGAVLGGQAGRQPEPKRTPAQPGEAGSALPRGARPGRAGPRRW